MAASPATRVWPFVRVKPVTVAWVATYTQRTAPSPLSVPPAPTPCPTTNVRLAPFTLCTAIGAVMATRFINPPDTTRPPVAYVPSATSTVSPALATSTPAWMVLLA